MKKAVIWDLDGTLIDSYELIVEAIEELLKPYTDAYSKEAIYKFVKEDSVLGFFKHISSAIDFDHASIKKAYSEYTKKNEHKLMPISGAIEVLKLLSDCGYTHYIYTHKGKTTRDVLVQNDMLHFFTEVVTSDNGFARKPHPDALDYLVQKYSLDKETTYYVGDRTLDVACARSADIKAIYLNQGMDSEVAPDFEIHHLSELVAILSK